MAVLLKYFVLGFSALLPVINPLGSALIFLGIVGHAPADKFRDLARRIAVATTLFLGVIELIGATLLNFFGISLPVVQLAGGLVLAAMGWGLLQEKNGNDERATAQQAQASGGALEEKIFYPLTFPITAGPGCIVVILTLGAHASRNAVLNSVLAHVGILVAIVAVCLTVYLSYTYAPKLATKIAPQTVQGILRVIAFVLLCIGVQIAWKGLEALVMSMSK